MKKENGMMAREEFNDFIFALDEGGRDQYTGGFYIHDMLVEFMERAKELFKAYPEVIDGVPREAHEQALATWMLYLAVTARYAFDPADVEVRDLENRI